MNAPWCSDTQQGDWLIAARQTYQTPGRNGLDCSHQKEKTSIMTEEKYPDLIIIQHMNVSKLHAVPIKIGTIMYLSKSIFRRWDFNILGTRDVFHKGVICHC